MTCPHCKSPIKTGATVCPTCKNIIPRTARKPSALDMVAVAIIVLYIFAMMAQGKIPPIWGN